MVFKPKGDEPEWRMIYRRISPMQPGDEISYAELGEALGTPFRPQHRNALDRAIKQLQIDKSRTLVNVRGKGYRMPAAAEHENLALNHQRRGRRQIGKALAAVRSANRSELDPDTARRLDQMENAYGQQAAMLDRLSRRQKQTAQDLQALRREHSGDIADLSGRLDKLTEALARNGIPIDEHPADQLAAGQTAAAN